MKQTNEFLRWLGNDYEVVSIKTQVIGNTLTTDTYTLSDGRTFVVADRTLVSYDKGYYMTYERKDETSKVIETIVWNYSYKGAQAPFYFNFKLIKIDMKQTVLEKAKEITSQEYMSLKNPIFQGQTRLDDNYQYWMLFEDNGTLYKIHNRL